MIVELSNSLSGIPDPRCCQTSRVPGIGIAVIGALAALMLGCSSGNRVTAPLDAASDSEETVETDVLMPDSITTAETSDVHDSPPEKPVFIVRGNTRTAVMGTNGALAVLGSIERGDGAPDTWLYLRQAGGEDLIVEDDEILGEQSPGFALDAVGVLADGSALVGTSRAPPQDSWTAPPIEPGDRWLTRLQADGTTAPLLNYEDVESSLPLNALVVVGKAVVGFALQPDANAKGSKLLEVYDIADIDAPVTHAVPTPALSQIIATSDAGGPVIAASAFGGFEADAWFGRVSADGALTQDQTLVWSGDGPEKPNPSTQPLALVAMPDGRIAVLGRARTHNGGRARSWVRMLDENGATVFEVTKLDPESDRSARGGVVLADGRLLVVGVTGSGQTHWYMTVDDGGAMTTLTEDAVTSVCNPENLYPSFLGSHAGRIVAVVGSNVGTTLEWGDDTHLPSSAGDYRWVFPPGGPFASDGSGFGAPCGREWGSQPR